MKKLWGSRFEGVTHGLVEEFTSSLLEDQRLWKADLQASLAHVQMLVQTQILSSQEGALLEKGLLKVREDLSVGKIAFYPGAEDVHSELERLLTEAIGETAGKVHTARSRNDQVATATRLYLREEIGALLQEIRALQRVCFTLAEKHLETVLPGMTHFQHAQPVSLAHHLMAYFWMLQRDRDRLEDCKERINRLPLGSGALAGTSFPIDRDMVCRSLGFAGTTENSLDAVSDRDFVVEFLNAATLLLVHLSRLSEELVVWSSPAFGFVQLSDGTTTGSSMMPQKKNPDVAELIRGRVGRLTGAWVGMTTALKGLPLSYNRDLQEDKHHLFQGLDTALSCTRLMKLQLEEAKFHPEAMAQAIEGDFSNATDLADHLVKKGVAFREAHAVVGNIVRDCVKQRVSLESLSPQQLKAYHPLLNESVQQILQPVQVMHARTSQGGTAPSAVKAQLQKAKELL